MKSRAALAALLIAGSAQAAFWDGNTLLSRLTSDDAALRLSGLAYVMGVHDSLEKINHCPPTNATAGQMRDIVRNYLTNLPAERHLSAESLVLKALELAFPCQKRNNSGSKSL